MTTIAVQPQTKKRLNSAIKIYCKQKQLPKEMEEKISYDFIITQLLDDVNIPKEGSERL